MNTVGSYLLLGGIGLLYAVAGRWTWVPSVRPWRALRPILWCQRPSCCWRRPAREGGAGPVPLLVAGRALGVAQPRVGDDLRCHGGARHLRAGAARVRRLGRSHAPRPHAAAPPRRGQCVLGAEMALQQRHLKRLLAFSTVSHTGMLLIGLALLNRDGVSGMLLYMVGHGLVKGALFMVAGIQLTACGGVHLIEIRGQGARVWPAGLRWLQGGVACWLAGRLDGWRPDADRHRGRVFEPAVALAASGAVRRRHGCGGAASDGADISPHLSGARKGRPPVMADAAAVVRSAGRWAASVAEVSGALPRRRLPCSCSRVRCPRPMSPGVPPRRGCSPGCRSASRCPLLPPSCGGRVCPPLSGQRSAGSCIRAEVHSATSMRGQSGLRGVVGGRCRVVYAGFLAVVVAAGRTVLNRRVAATCGGRQLAADMTFARLNNSYRRAANEAS